MKLILLLILSSFTFSTFAQNIKITGVKLDKSSNDHLKLEVSLDGNYDVLPDLTIKKNYIQLAMPEAIVWPSIKRNSKLTKNQTVKILAYQYNKNLARVRLILPSSTKKYSKKVKVVTESNKIILTIPFKKFTQIKAKAIIKKEVSKYDESYLDQLLKTNNKQVNVKVEKKLVKRKTFNDIINLKKSAVQKDHPKKKFSVMGYLGKFVAFLSIILLGFYGVFAFFKKGAFGKSKLGFLNNTKAVEVLSNTYIGPKKNLMLVRAHKQVFLVGSSDQGLQLISEVGDTAGLMKEGERAISGNNFDTTQSSTKIDSTKFKLKEVLTESTPVNLSSSKTSRFKENLKEKVKNLKAMQ